jgi:hypothetical protein
MAQNGTKIKPNTAFFSVLVEVLSTKPTAEKKMDALKLSS